jgi:hypothetical protein
MFREAEAQLYKKCMDVIPVPPKGLFETRLMNDIKFYAGFLAFLCLQNAVIRL